MIKNILLGAIILSGFSCSAHAQVVVNPGILPSSPLIAGSCVQATGPFSIATTSSACGSGSGSIGGPTSSTAGDIATWNNTTGTLLADSGLSASLVPRLNAPNTFTLSNIIENGESVPSTSPSITAQNAADTAALLFLPDLDVGDYDPLAQAGDAGIIDGTANNENFGVTVGLWSTSTPTGFRISSTGVNFAQRPTFNGATPWDSANLTPSNYATIAGNNTFTGTNTYSAPVALNQGATIASFFSLTTPVINFAGNPPASDPINGLYYGGNPIFYIVPNTGVYVNGDGNNLYLSSDVGSESPGCFINTSGLMTCDAGLTVSAGATSLGSATVAAPALSDNSTSIPSTAWVNSVISTAIGGGGTPTFGNTTINGSLTVSGVTTLPGIAVSTTALNSTNPFDAPTFNATGTGIGQGLISAGYLTAAGPVTLGNSSNSSITLYGNVAIGSGSESGTLTVHNGITTPAVTGSGSTPTISTGSGAGTDASSSVAGTALSGSFAITAGTNPVNGGVVATITAINTSFPSVPFCVVSSGSASTAILYTTPSLSSGTLTVAFTLANNEQLASGTNYVYNWFCP